MYKKYFCTDVPKYNNINNNLVLSHVDKNTTNPVDVANSFNDNFIQEIYLVIFINGKNHFS